MSFARPELIWLAAALPMLVALGVWAYARRRALVARTLGDPSLVRRLGAGDLERFPRVRLAVLCLASAVLGFAAAGPRWGQRTTLDESSTLNVVLAMDISKSMLATDVEPNRLERERLFARRMVRELSGDRLGMVVFAGRAYVLAPLTVDHGALNLYLDALDPEMVSQGGSSMASAITQATDLARGSEEAGGDRAIVLITDGEATEEQDGIRAAADRAARAGVTVFTVGVGTERGSPIPERDPRTDEITGYKRDPDSGEVHVSRMDEKMLRDVAETTGGEYVALANTGSLDALLSSLRGLERSAAKGGRRVEQPDRFAIFVGIALLLLALDALWPRLAAIRAPRPERKAESRQKGRESPPSAFAPGAAVRQAIVVFALLAVTGFGIGDVERGNRHYRAGRFAEAVEAYQEAIRDGNNSPQVRYNLGTALLRLGRFDEAEQQLQLALAGVDPDLRQRAYYNLGNRYLEAARADSNAEGQDQLLDGAIDAYKQSLRLQPGDADAKWNLEMALREKDETPDPPPGGQGESQQQDDPQQNPQGGGGGSNDSPASEQEGPRQPGGSARNSMSREQADRILSAVEQDERDLTREKLRKGQRRTPVGRDW